MPLIARDLAGLGHCVPTASNGFAHEDHSGAALLGASWVLAGSSLGNRAILGEMRRSGGGEWPCEFLADPAMLGFWKDLRIAIERPATESESTSATEAAIAVFDHFLALVPASREAAPALN